MTTAPPHAHVTSHARYRYVTSHSPAIESFELAIELLQQGRCHVAPVFTHVLPFEEMPNAYAMADGYTDGVIKTIITYESTGDYESSRCAPCE